MSELNEELLNDDTDDFPELEEADEDALLQDDEDADVLNLVPEEELGDGLESDQKPGSDVEGKRGSSRQDKFATERKRITAPESTDEEKPNNNNRFVRQNNRGRGRGGRFQHQQGRYQQFNQGRGRNKTVLINPRFQGVVHVNNNARLAWDTQQQQFQPNIWVSGGPPNNNMGPPMQVMHPQMHAMQGPPQMQFQSSVQQYPGPPQMQHHHQRPMHMQQMHQGPPMQSMGPPGQQNFTFSSPPQQGFMPQPLPPGVPQSSMQPPNNMPTSSPYWDGQHQATACPQGPNQQIMPSYMQNNFEHRFEPPQPIIINTSQPPPQMQMQIPNFQYNNQFNHGAPLMQHQQNPNMQQLAIMQQPRAVYANNNNNMHPPQGNAGLHKKDMFSPKRKVATAFTPNINKKRYIRDRLGSVGQSQVKVKKNFTARNDDKRPSVVKEVTVTNVTTVKIEDDEQTRDLRMKIEEQRKKREQLLKWKELRRAQEKGIRGSNQLIKRALHQSGSVRTPVLQPIKQIDEQKPFRGKGIRNIRATQSVNKRILLAPGTANTVVKVEEPEGLDKKHLSTFLADRTVLVKDEALMDTRQVVIKNISTSTGDRKIFQICRGIGEVQKLHRDKNDRHATITFKSVASAHAFFKKYQRHMLDLSMIEVSLTPESDGKDLA